MHRNRNGFYATTVREWTGACLSAVCLVAALAMTGCAGVNGRSANQLARGDNPVIRVLLVEATPEAMLLSRSGWAVETLDGKESTSKAPNTQMSIILLDDGEVAVKDKEGTFQGTALALESLNPGASMWVRTEPSCLKCKRAIDGRFYEGRIEAYPAGDGMVELVLVLPMEEYLRGVVPSEIGSDSPLQAMCAQAVAARTEAYKALITGKYAGDHYDICSTAACQVFTGNQRRSKKSDEAVRITRGQTLMYKGRPISAYYASNCGGHSEDIRNAWPKRAGEKAYWDTAGFDGEINPHLDLTREADFRKFLVMNPSVYCNPHKYEIPKWAWKNFRWTREATAGQLTERVARIKDIGRVTAIRPIRRGVSGRIMEIEFVGEKGTVRVRSELRIRRMFSPTLKSSAFVVDPEGPAGRPDKFVLHGAGSGHGVGMCQTGAMGMANAGKDYREILNHYYPKAVIETLY